MKMDKWRKIILILGIVYFILVLLAIAGFCMETYCGPTLEDENYPNPPDTCGCGWMEIVQGILVFGIPSWLLWLIISLRRKKIK
jgi:hypothetical protein